MPDIVLLDIALYNVAYSVLLKHVLRNVYSLMYNGHVADLSRPFFKWCHWFCRKCCLVWKVLHCYGEKDVEKRNSRCLANNN